ncbi:hypothetical protein Hanom_Chr07g00623141 [Helianthus anomalus]
MYKSAQKSGSKSVSKFDLGDIDSLISPRSLKKELARGPSTTEPKTVGTRSKTGSKRNKPSDSTNDAFQVERHFHEVITEVRILDPHKYFVCSVAKDS